MLLNEGLLCSEIGFDLLKLLFNLLKWSQLTFDQVPLHHVRSVLHKATELLPRGLWVAFPVHAQLDDVAILDARNPVVGDTVHAVPAALLTFLWLLLFAAELLVGNVLNEAVGLLDFALGAQGPVLGYSLVVLIVSLLGRRARCAILLKWPRHGINLHGALRVCFVEMTAVLAHLLFFTC